MSNGDVAEPLAADLPSKSFLERLGGIFISPAEILADVVRKPDFVAPLITCVLAAIAFTETMLAKIGMERIVRTSLEQSGKASSMSPEQLDQYVRQGAKVGGVLTHIASVVGTPIFLLIIAGVGLLLLNSFFSQPVKFKTVFSLVSYSYLVTLLGAFMAIVLIFFGDPERFNPANPTPTTVGFFLIPGKVAKPLYAVASSFDLFTIWFLVLVAIGLAEATGRKTKPLPIFLSYVGLWCGWVIVKAGLAMIS